MRLTELAHNYLSHRLQLGDTAIDATAGNGHDTTMMAQCVGSTGHIIAIDIQASAITATRERLEAADRLSQATLHTDDHATVLQELDKSQKGKVSAITFNLGYLPGSNKQIQTTPPGTLSALNAASALLQPDGLLLVTAYRGHPGGLTEANEVADWMNALKSKGWHIKNHEPTVNSNRIPPILWVASQSEIQKD